MHVLIVGDGAMGRILSQELLSQDHQVFISRDIQDVPTHDFDVLIDFSHPDNVTRLCELATARQLPVVMATTGLTPAQFAQIDQLAQAVPVLYSANFSLGVILMNKVVKQVTQVLHDNFDIEIIEKHHRHKLDSPSGTANMLLQSIQSALPHVYDAKQGRQGFAKRKPNEIGIHSVRGGSYPGEHEVVFAGEDEVFAITHQAGSKRIFVRGAILGALWLTEQKPGRYSMEDLLEI